MRKKNLLIIEDESSLAKQLKWALSKEYAVSTAANIKQAKTLLNTKPFPVVTLDLGLPPFPDTPDEGFRFLEEFRSLAPYSKVIVITGNSEESNAVKAIGMGAADFCSKPIDLKLLEIVLSRTYRIFELEEASRRIQEQCGGAQLCGMLGISEPMGRLFDLIRQASRTDYTVLITGESGTGKEMAAQAIHTMSQRAKKPLVIVNCGAIPENLLESELFGHERGSFTGAVGRKIGRFEQADEGTLFLDEIGEMPLPLQVKILRFLQEGTIERVGGTGTMRLNIRVIAATNVDLEKAVEENSFREDLFHRLNVVRVPIPPLRERPEDILMLAQHFLREEMKQSGQPHLPFSPGALGALTAHSWPGNVRELQNRIRRAITVAQGVIQQEDLGLQEKADQKEARIRTLQEARDRAEQEAIRLAMAVAGNNISQTAKLLDISRPTLYELMRKHGL
jgi:two-component system, NtrC family, response regulator